MIYEYAGMAFLTFGEKVYENPSNGEEEQDGEPDQAEIRLIEDSSKPKDPTAAERQRRHRKRKRNGLNGVTCHATDRDNTAAPDHIGSDSNPDDLFQPEVLG